MIDHCNELGLLKVSEGTFGNRFQQRGRSFGRFTCGCRGTIDSDSTGKLIIDELNDHDHRRSLLRTTPMDQHRRDVVIQADV